MYSTKTIHKNINPNYKQSYTSIGDPYHSSIEKLPQRFRSKQFVTQRHPRNADNGFFSKLLHEGDPYIEIAESYLETFPLDKRKLGFGSRDAMKRGEYTSTKATERFRETLKNERKAASRKEQAMTNAKEITMNLRNAVPREPKTKDGRTLHLSKYMYDIGRTQITPFNPHHQKDTFYNIPKHAPVDSMQRNGGEDDIRRLGSQRPMSAMIGEASWKYNYSKPEFGRRKGW